MKMKIWYRYLFRQLLKTFLFFLICFFAMYVIIDLSVHGVRFLSIGKATFSEISLFYLHNFAMHLHLFMPIAFLLSILKVLLDLNSHNELVALQMAGLSKKILLRPFFLLATFLSLILYINNQWLAPDALDASDAFRSQHSKKRKKVKREHLYNLALDDDTELIYQSFDEKKKELFDVFWVKSANDIWHMKYLKIDAKHAKGRFVDRLQRNDQGQFEKTESFLEYSFRKLPWNEHTELERFVPFENRSLLTLLKQALTLSADRPRIFCHLHYKMALPLIPYFILIALSPVAMHFSRTRSSFLIVAISLLAFIGLMTILDGMLILGENRVIPGYLAIWGPIAIAFFATLRPFAKL